jgi:predicted nucleic acid-binding protein
MRVLVDTSVWSLALRRSKKAAEDDALRAELADLLTEVRAVIIGPIRQEILSGVAADEQFERIQNALSSIPDHPITSADYITAARFANQCLRHGIQGSHTDFLICAVAQNHSLEIFTTDNDFGHYAKQIPIRLHTIGA